MSRLDPILVVSGVFILMLLGSCGDQHEEAKKVSKLVIENQRRKILNGREERSQQNTRSDL